MFAEIEPIIIGRFRRKRLYIFTIITMYLNCQADDILITTFHSTIHNYM